MVQFHALAAADIELCSVCVRRWLWKWERLMTVF
jgi:hypothetical protein